MLRQNICTPNCHYAQFIKNDFIKVPSLSQEPASRNWVGVRHHWNRHKKTGLFARGRGNETLFTFEQCSTVHCNTFLRGVVLK